MAASDARPVPIKNTAFRVVLPIMDADGDLVTGATGLDSEVSKDQGTFADCTNEATEIATTSGMYYLDLTATEMNADCVAVIVKTTSSGAKTTVLVFYPEETGDINVDVTGWLGTAPATPATAGYPVVTHKVGTGTGELAIASGIVQSNMKQANDNATAAAKFALSADSVTTGTIDATAFTPLATEFETNLTEATTGHYNSGLIRWPPTSPLYGQQGLVQSYTLVGGRGHFVVTGLVDAPPNLAPFTIV